MSHPKEFGDKKVLPAAGPVRRDSPVTISDTSHPMPYTRILKNALFDRIHSDAGVFADENWQANVSLDFAKYLIRENDLTPISGNLTFCVLMEIDAAGWSVSFDMTVVIDQSVTLQATQRGKPHFHIYRTTPPPGPHLESPPDFIENLKKL